MDLCAPQLYSISAIDCANFLLACLRDNTSILSNSRGLGLAAIGYKVHYFDTPHSQPIMVDTLSYWMPVSITPIGLLLQDSKHSIFYLHLIGTKITVHRTHFLKLKQFNHNYSFDAHLKVVYEILCSA